jgi:hypothetical protein
MYQKIVRQDERATQDMLAWLWASRFGDALGTLVAYDGAVNVGSRTRVAMLSRRS